MDAAVKAHNAEDLNIVKVSAPAVSAGSMILGYAAEYKTDLIVIGTHGRRGLGHLLLGSIAEEVVRSSPFPVLTVRELETPKGPEKTERILAPVDFSDYSRRAVLRAKEIASDYGARLQLLHVVEQPVYPSFYPIGESPSPSFPSLQTIEAKARDEMESMLKEGPIVPTETHVIEGRAARDILKFAESNSTDLIVISTHGLSGFKHMLIGSVAEKVARQAPCPVLTVK
jgi:nucleotide-binding universal stress UspA family protein